MIKLSILSLIADSILAINVILFFLTLFKREKVYKIFSVYLLVILIGEITSKIMIHNKYENIVMSHYYFIFQFIFLSLFFYELIKSKKQKIIIKVLLFVIPIVILIHYILNPELIFKFNVLEVFLTSFSIICYTTFHFYNMLNAPKTFYYINSGILIYLFGSSIIFLAGNLVILIPANLDLGYSLYYVNVLLYIAYQLLIFTEWFKIRQNSKFKK